MGIFDELKKVIFGAKSVTKSTAQKTYEAGKEKIKEGTESAAETLDKYADRAKKMMEDMEADEKVQKAKKEINETTEKIKSEASEALDKIKDMTEELGSNVLKTGAAAMAKGKDIASKLTEKGKDLASSDEVDQIKDRVGDIKQDIKTKFDETVRKAEELAKQEQLNKDIPYQTSEKARKTLEESSLPDDGDDFWSKAEAYAEGNYRDVRSTGSIRVEESSLEPKPKELAPAPNMEDLDGDGSEIIDDAILDEEE